MLSRSLLILLFTFFLSGRIPKQDYGPVQLDWNVHYKGKPDYNSKFYALTALIFNYSYESTISRNKLSLKFKFAVDVNTAKSWVKNEKITSEAISADLLKHEQGHANINYLLMRETEVELRSRRYNTKTYKKEIETTAKKVFDHYEEMQQKYDEETNHGSKSQEQEKWDGFIMQSLSEFEKG